MPTSLKRIAEKAVVNKKHRFGNLYGILNKETLTASFQRLNKKSAAGVDGVNAAEYRKNLSENVDRLVTRLQEKRYKAKLIRRVFIPKGQGKLRPLGIPALEDKIVQYASAQILMSLWNGTFISSNFGYRPQTGPQQAVKELSRKMLYGKYRYVVEADIKGFFDNLSHEWLMQMLELKIADNAFLALIRKWLKAGVLQDGIVEHPAKGSPQGSVISPVLANIYLHYVLDLWFEKVIKPKCNGEAYICRYADDFLCYFEREQDARRFYKELPERMKKFGLELAPEKTRIISFQMKENTSFEFLGFEFRWGKTLKGKMTIRVRTSRKKLRKSMQAVKEWCKEIRNKRIAWIMEKLNKKLQGYFNYYGVRGNYRAIEFFYTYMIRTLYKWLNRRSGHRSYTWETFNDILKMFKVARPKIVDKTA